MEGRWLPPLAVAATVLVVTELISPPGVLGETELQTGAWLALASALVLLIGAILSIGKVSFSVAIEGRETKRRVAAVDHRQDTTENSALAPEPEPEAEDTEPSPPAPSTRTASRRKA